MVDYEKKSKVLKTDLCKRINRIDRLTYLNSIEGIVHDYDLDSEYFDLLLEYDYDDVKEARKINKASYQRVKRLKDRITYLITNNVCLWCTLTFTDDVLNSTSPDTRKQYVRKYLKAISPNYIANIDYGSENEREHYHALVVADYVPSGSWSYGFDEYIKVRTKQTTSPVRMAKYISKLTNHAIKETTKRCSIIYSRVPVGLC